MLIFGKDMNLVPDLFIILKLFFYKPLRWGQSQIILLLGPVPQDEGPVPVRLDLSLGIVSNVHISKILKFPQNTFLICFFSFTDKYLVSVRGQVPILN